MENTPYELLGYYSSVVNIKKSQNSDIDEININIGNIDFDSQNKVCSIEIVVKIDFSDIKDNLVSFVSGFKIQNAEIIEELTKFELSKSDNKEFESEQFNRMISIMTASVFPYVRQYLHNITSDSVNAIILPIIDVRQIDVRKSISIKKSKNID